MNLEVVRSAEGVSGFWGCGYDNKATAWAFRSSECCDRHSRIIPQTALPGVK